MGRDPNITSKIMSTIRSKDTKAELIVRKALWGLGFRYRKHYRKVPGSPDMVLIKQKVAIFIDGDFWHGHNCRNTKPEDNKDYWINKIKRNKERDFLVNQVLIEKGWKVFRIWECDIKKSQLPKTFLDYFK